MMVPAGMKSTLDHVQCQELGQRTAAEPALQIGGIGVDTLRLNVLKFNCNCNLSLLVWWGVSSGSY